MLKGKTEKDPDLQINTLKPTHSTFARRALPLALSLFLMMSGSFVQAQTLPLPPRPADARDRDQILQTITPLARDVREDTLFQIVMRGNVPEFMRTLVPVSSSATINGKVYSVTYYVTPDYLCVGPDDRYFLTPMTPLLAQRIADALNCTLPTRKMVNDIYTSAGLKLGPEPIPPSAEMITVPVFAQHDSMVWAQREPELASYPLGTLVGGTKKDVVISNLIRTNLKPLVPKPVVIYGWHHLNGVPIQPLYNGHEETYADYSHGIRLVQESVLLNGSPTTVSDILKNDTLAAILSDEGAIPIPRYGDEPTGIESDPAGKPQGTMMFQNYPNPFNPETVISGEWETASDVTLAVYDLLGREVAVLADGRYPAGKYSFSFNATGLASGVYYYRLTAGPWSMTRAMLLEK
jgi:hypothetical protein